MNGPTTAAMPILAFLARGVARHVAALTSTGSLLVTTNAIVVLVRQAIFHVLDDRDWNFEDDEQRVDFADKVATWIPFVQPSVANEIGAERQRQKDKEGWSEAHDDGHAAGCLAVAGACYALFGIAEISGERKVWRGIYAEQARALWPWDREWWKPKNPRRDLIRAAALIVAEIEKLDRSLQAVDITHQGKS